MPYVVDASVVVRWFVAKEGHEAAKEWLCRLAEDPLLLVAPDLLSFELFGVLARLQPRGDAGWVERCMERFEALGLRTLPTTLSLYRLSFQLARTLRISGWNAVYLTHAESLSTSWLTADQEALRRLAGDPRVLPL